MDKILESIQLIIDHQIKLVGTITQNQKIVEIPVNDIVLKVKAVVIRDYDSVFLIFDDIVDFEDSNLKEQILGLLNKNLDKNQIVWHTISKNKTDLEKESEV